MHVMCLFLIILVKVEYDLFQQLPEGTCSTSGCKVCLIMSGKNFERFINKQKENTLLFWLKPELIRKV